MSALAFTNSIHYSDSAKCLAFLQEKGVEIHVGLTAEMPAVVFHGYFTPENISEWDRVATEAELMEKSKGAWSEWLNSEEGAWSDIDTQGLVCCQFNPDDEELILNDLTLAAWVVEQIRMKKAEVIDAKFAELCPKVSKSKSKATGTRSAKRSRDEFDCVITNTEDTAQGGGGDGKPEYEYCLPCDDEAVMLKDGKIQAGKGKDGKDKKPQSWKAVKKQTPFLTEGACKCGITWDRAKGSKKLEELSIKGAFVMGCDKERAPIDPATSTAWSDFCSKHQGKTSVYSDKYKTGEYKGLTYAQVLYILHQEGGEVLADDGDWIQAECGENWMTEIMVGA